MHQRPNILLITADQWRGECLSALGHAQVKTPNLDKLASDGAIFKHHYSQATPCGPARTCLYTGMYLHNHRSLLNGTPLSSRHTNIALQARKAGYEPALFGYTDISPDPNLYDAKDPILCSYEGVLPGMDPICAMGGNWSRWRSDLKRKGYKVTDNPAELFKPLAPYPESKSKGKTYPPMRFSEDDSYTAFLVDEVLSHLSVRKQKPWFVHLSLYSPHPPFIAPEPYNKMYDAKDMPPPVRQKTIEKEAEQHPWLAYYLFNQQARLNYAYGVEAQPKFSISNQELRQLKATYYGMMSHVDSQIGRLINGLKESGDYENTMIVFTSDHGEHLGDHWMLSKHSYFDQTFHIPLIIKNPSSQAKSKVVVDEITENVDIMPTILERIGVKVPQQCDGYSLNALCDGHVPENWRQEYHAEFDLRSAYEVNDPIPLGLDMQSCAVSLIASKQFKYVHFAGLPNLLFDRHQDPGELINRANDPDYDSQQMSYAGKMLDWRLRFDAPELTDLHLTPQGVVSGLRAR